MIPFLCGCGHTWDMEAMQGSVCADCGQGPSLYLIPRSSYETDPDAWYIKPPCLALVPWIDTPRFVLLHSHIHSTPDPHRRLFWELDLVFQYEYSMRPVEYPPIWGKGILQAIEEADA